MEWKVEEELVAYPEALRRMESRVLGVQQGSEDELVWLLEHPPLYTAGSSAQGADLLGGVDFPVYETGRGGQYTYHGPGQRVAYLVLDLNQRGKDVRDYVKRLEGWIISVLKQYGLKGFIRDGRVGVWVETPQGEAKIAAIGVRVQKWVASHGIAFNVHPDLSHYRGIVPCGIREFGVTSLKALGIDAPMSEVDAALKKNFAKYFG